jgi:hypothetical protein
MKMVLLKLAFSLIPAGFFLFLWLLGWNTLLLTIILACTGPLSALYRMTMDPEDVDPE